MTPIEDIVYALNLTILGFELTAPVKGTTSNPIFPLSTLAQDANIEGSVIRVYSRKDFSKR